MLEVCNIACSRAEKVLFDAFSFAVPAGSFLQVTGANGAGKSTLLRILAGLITPDSGEIFFNGVNVAKDRALFYQQMLFLGHRSGIKRELSALENLAFYQQMHGDCNADSLWNALQDVGLSAKEHVPVMQLSAGQAQRVALARLLLTDAKMWILDEPFTAIDDEGVQILQRLFWCHVERGGAVIFATHQRVLHHCSRLQQICLGSQC
ncbi:MAG: cytochrome c biogenesis heme-transporting ATPase CcmA [Enterovibrio sp.]